MGKEEANSPGGIVVESLLNMGTVSALTMEEERFKLFEKALNDTEEQYVRQGFHQGALTGVSMFVQQWINALQFWFGGWLLFKYPDVYTPKDFTWALMIILFSLFALGAAFQDIADREKVEKSLSRIFYLLDKRSEIDPLSEEGKTMNYAKISKIENSNYEKIINKKRESSLKNIEEQDRDSEEHEEVESRSKEFEITLEKDQDPEANIEEP